jgi:type IV secretion system protein TrbL
MKALVAAAFSAGGQSGGGYQALLDPSQIAGRGLVVTLPLAQKIDAVSPLDVGTILLMGGLLLLIMLAFIVMAVNVAWAVIEYYIYLCLAGLLMPFALLAQTRFLADKGINAVIAATLKLVAYAFVLGLIKPIIDNIEFHKDFGLKLGLNWNDIFSMVMVVLFCLGLCVKVPQIAAGFIHGSPSISGSGMVLGLAGAAAYGVGALAQGAAQAVGWAGGRIGDGLNWAGDRIPPAEQSAMGAASRAGTMGASESATPAAPGNGAMFVAAYYPASNQLGKAADLALPENVIDMPGEQLGPGDNS